MSIRNEEPVNHYGSADWDLENIAKEVKDASNGSLDYYRRLGRRSPNQGLETPDGTDSAA